jgi:signal transduction histidine kinase
MKTQNLLHLLSTAINNTEYLFWIYDESDNLIYANALFFKLTGIAVSSIGKPLNKISSKEVAQLIKIRLEATRKQDKALYFNEKMQPNNNEQYYESHWFNITDGKSRFVAGYSKNITAQKKKSLEIQKLASRLSYISMNTSECVWEWELENNKLHINKKLNSISGYYTETKYRGIKFWVQQVVYKEDRIGILRKLNRCINSGSACLKLQYRVVAKTGETRWLCDTIHFVYRFGKPYRVLGSLKDKTDMVALENEVKLSESEKTKAVNAAGIKAQEEVRDSISKELHDNINQLILSSKLYISIARNQPEIADEMLDKAIEYQFAALEEGRKLSKQLSVAAIHHHGFSITVNEIVSHLTINKIKVVASIDSTLPQKLNTTQATMIIRILQEQSSNILKYAKPKNVQLILTENNGTVMLLISDDGNGFDQNKTVSGIGLLNIQSRVLALDGEIDIQSSPGNGCKMKVEFKLFPKENVNAA